MNLIKGINYNLKGLILGIKTPSLLCLGLIRFVIVLIITIVLATYILMYNEQIMSILWSQPESAWLFWIWKILSWLLSICLTALSTLFSYIISQILFSVIIMDIMSKITEKIVTGSVKELKQSFLIQFIYLIKQEIPRAFVPILLSLIILMAGLLTPFGAILAIIASIASVIFLAWDNTDLLPARQFVPFKERFNYLKQNIFFHLGFGLWFLVPVLNILFLSFAPVGATLYQLDKNIPNKNITDKN